MASPKKNKTQPPATVQNFPIVGIGASAGGLDAFKRLLAAIPENSGMAYVLVQHLDPSHESILPEILQRVTKIPVHEITDDIHLAPDHIYIIPSNKILTSTDGVLQLNPREKKILNLSIDIFFTSLADVHKEFAVGVVLSGTGSDGTLGLKAIKEHGGISIAQDSESAAYDSMPQSAVNAGVVDFVLAPEKIPAQLLQINSAYKINHFYKDEEEIPKDDEGIFKQILLVLRQRSGVDFTYYKQPTFHRRIARRIALAKKKNLAEYLKFLRSDKAEQDALFQDVLIPVTSFFRDPKTFQTLTESVFPALFKHKTANDPIRIWIAGCSTGEEAFSIAICLHEFLGSLTTALSEGDGDFYNPLLGGRGPIQIFATDISEKVIKKARSAVYTRPEVENLSEQQLRNYFRKNNVGYELNKFIRDMCVFAPHNFLKDPPFAKMDLISCRNVLIYMDTFLQKKAFTTFHYALKEKGFLLLGKSETTGASSDLFTQVEKHEKIYSRKPVPARYMHVASERKEDFFVTKDIKVTKQEGTQSDFRKSAEAIMISKSPASVVVNEQMDIVHIHGNITPFLQTPQGKPTYNLLKMAREGLAFELRNAIHKVTKEQISITKESIPVKANEKQSLVTIEIFPLTDNIEPHYLIRFEETIIPVVQKEKKSSSGKIMDTSRKISGQNEQLEKELSQTREDIRSITEDMEASNEELQSANEELQSSNEEMQSLNEELETSKEELQSTNEELTIVNQELLEKQEQLNASYSEKVKASKRIEESEKEQKKLARELKLATDSAKVGIWSLDIISSKLEWSNIHKKMWGYSEHQEDLTYEDWHKVIVPEDKELAFQRIEESKDNNSLYEVDYRITRANDGATVWIKSTGQYQYDEFGAAHTLTGISIDITEQKEAEEKIKESEARSRAFVESNVVAVCFTHLESATIFEANDAYLNMLGYTRQDLKEGKINWISYTPPEYHVNDHEAIEKAKSMKVSPPYEKEIMRTDGKRISVIKARTIINKDQIMSVFVDITDRKSAEENLKKTAIKLATKNKLIEISEAKFRNLILQAPVLITTFQGPTFIVETINKTALEIWGKTYEQVINKPLFEVSPEMEEGLKTIFNNIYSTGEPFIANEYKLQLKRQGKPDTAYFNSVFQPLRDLNNKICGIILIGTEVTEAVDARKLIEASEMRFSNILSQSIMAIGILKGSDMVVTFANNALLATWGKGGNIIGKPLLEVLPEIKDQGFPQLLQQVYTTGAPYYGNETKVTLIRNGKEEPLYYNFVYQPYTEVDNTITGITILATEVTEQVLAKKQIEESENWFRIFADSIQNLAWIAKADGFIYWYNQRWYDYTGTTFKEMEGLGWQKVHHPDKVETVTEFLKDAWKKEEAFELTCLLRMYNGEYRWFLTRAYPVKDANGNIERWIGTNTDIHEQKTKEQQKDEFISIASHEMKTPLTTAKGYLELLRVLLSNENQNAFLYANKANQAIERLNLFVTELLDVSKIQNGKLDYNISTFDFNEMVNEAIENIQLTAKNHRLQKIGNSLHQIKGDKYRLQQVMINLLTNAVKYSPNADKVIIQVEEQHGNIQVSVQDFGVGMLSQHLEKVFERYYRVQEHAVHFQGLGIGLHISRNIILRHEGKMWVESEPNKGSIFHFTLPI